MQKFTTFVSDEEFDSVGVTWDISSDRNGSNIAVHMDDDHFVDALKTFFKQNQSMFEFICDCFCVSGILNLWRYSVVVELQRGLPFLQCCAEVRGKFFRRRSHRSR